MNWLSPMGRAKLERRKANEASCHGKHSIPNVMKRNGGSAGIVSQTRPFNEHYQGWHRAGAMTSRRYWAVGFTNEGREIVHVAALPVHNNGTRVRNPNEQTYANFPWFNVKECFRPCCFSGDDAVMDVFLPRDPKPTKHQFPQTMIVDEDPDQIGRDDRPSLGAGGFISAAGRFAHLRPSQKPTIIEPPVSPCPTLPSGQVLPHTHSDGHPCNEGRAQVPDDEADDDEFAADQWLKMGAPTEGEWSGT